MHLERALRLLNEIPHAEHAADTHLNICAVLSQLGRHSQALEHAQVYHTKYPVFMLNMHRLAFILEHA